MSVDTSIDQVTVDQERPWHQWYEANVPVNLDIPEHDLPVFLKKSAEKYTKRNAIRFFGRGISFRELDQEVNRMANALLAFGIEPGDRVALIMPNSPQMVICYYGVMRAGAVVVPTNPLYTARELQHQLNDSGARIVVCLSRMFKKLQGIREELPDLEHVVVTNIKEYLPFFSRIYFSLAREKKEGHSVELPDDGRTSWLPDFLKRGKNSYPDVRRNPDDVAVLQYTAGTTGTPKGVMLTHRNLVTGALHAQVWTGNIDRPAGHDVVLGVIPVFHPLAQTTVMNYPISAGATTVLLPRFSVGETLQAIQKERPNMFPGVPSLFRVLLESRDIDNYQLDSLQACISGAAPLPREVQSRFEALAGVRMVEGYGLTEAPVTHCNPMLGERREGSIGVPLPNTDAVIVDLEDRSNRLPPGETGELAVRGPQVMRGYWKRDDRTAENLIDGWYFTGDTGLMDEDGFFRLVDRKSDMIIVGGYNVFPSEIEKVISEHPRVHEVAVARAQDPRRGEVPRAFVVAKEGADLTRRDILSHCRENLAHYKIPRSIEFRKELPKNMLGKVLRRELIESAAHQDDGRSDTN
jgi:long-chain acyl-CoA synthetase